MVIFDEIKVTPFEKTSFFKTAPSSSDLEVLDDREKDVNNFYGIPYSKKNLKTFTVNFSTNSDAKILEKMNGIKTHTAKQYPIILKYRFETYTDVNSDIQEFEGSLYVNPAEGYVLHYHPDVFDSNAVNAILRLVILFMKKKGLENKVFKVYNEHSRNVSYIRVRETEDTDVSEKFIENSVANINRQVRNVLTPRGFLLASANETLYTPDQRREVNNVLFNRAKLRVGGIPFSSSVATSGDVLITNNRNLGISNGPFFTPFFDDNEYVNVVRTDLPLYRRPRTIIDEALETRFAIDTLKDITDPKSTVKFYGPSLVPYHLSGPRLVVQKNADAQAAAAPSQTEITSAVEKGIAKGLGDAFKSTIPNPIEMNQAFLQGVEDGRNARAFQEQMAERNLSGQPSFF